MVWPNLSFTTWVDGVHTYAASILNAIQDALIAIQTDVLAGWLTSPWAWTYVSASTFTVAGDRTATFHKGTKLMWTQTSVKYAYVQSSSYSAGTGLTTVTIAAGSDFSIANAAITSPYYSYAESPQGFPDWFNWTPAYTGFSVDPSANKFFRFRITGRTCQIALDTGTGGTSNATNFKVSLPIPAATIATWLGNWEGPLGFAQDNSASLTTACRATVTEAGTTVDFYSDMNAGVWTASGNKRARCSLTYEI